LKGSAGQLTWSGLGSTLQQQHSSTAQHMGLCHMGSPQGTCLLLLRLLLVPLLLLLLLACHVQQMDCWPWHLLQGAGGWRRGGAVDTPWGWLASPAHCTLLCAAGMAGCCCCKQTAAARAPPSCLQGPHPFCSASFQVLMSSTRSRKSMRPRVMGSSSSCCSTGSDRRAWLWCSGPSSLWGAAARAVRGCLHTAAPQGWAGVCAARTRKRGSWSPPAAALAADTWAGICWARWHGV
jgi:hypothetical protein